MKINTSICSKCTHFWHECNTEDGSGDTCCAEYCYHNSVLIKDRFYDDLEITECKGFETR